MSELKGYIEATKIEPKLEDITITPSKQEQNFKSKVDGYDKIRVNAIPCETLNVTPKKEKQVIEGMYDKVNVEGISAEILNITPKKESQYFDGIYEKIYVNEIERDNLTVTPSMAEQSFNGLYENVVVKKITGDTLDITPTEEQQTFNGLYETVNVEAVDSEEVTIDPDFSTQDTFEIVATEGKYITKATVNKDENLVPENILEGNNIYGVDGTFKPLDTSDATATAGDIVKDKIAYVNGEKVIGTLESTESFDTSLIRNTSNMFIDRTDMGEALIFNTENVTNMSYMFYNCTNLVKCNSYNTSKCKDFSYMFGNCNNLIDVEEMDFSNANDITNIFLPCYNLTNLGGLKNLGKNYTKANTNYAQYTLDLQYSNKLTHDSLINVINGLYDLASNGKRNQQLVLGSTNLAKLTADEIAIATNKGWTVS